MIWYTYSIWEKLVYIASVYVRYLRKSNKYYHMQIEYKTFLQ